MPVAAARQLFKRKSACQKLPQSALQVLFLGVLLFVLFALCVIYETWFNGDPNEASFVAHSRADREYHMHFVDYANDPQHGARWLAAYNKFASRGVEEDEEKIEQNELKTKDKDNEVLKMHETSSYAVFGDTLDHMAALVARSDVVLPRDFDARTRWPLCASVHTVSNQAGCGSCFAVSAASVMADRICIGTNGTQQPQISARDLLNCCPHCGTCNGSLWPLFSFTWFKTNGVVSGGPYKSFEGCKPYDKPASCGNPCSADLYYTAQSEKVCERKCQSLYDKSYEEDLYRSSSAYWVRPISHADEYFPEMLQKINATIGDVSYTTLIKRELFLYGPVMACFSVYDEFQHYRSGEWPQYKMVLDGQVAGVYSKTAPDTKMLYGHCAKLLGWGKDDKSEWFTYTNSWGRDFGENGFFRMSIDNLPEEVAAGRV